MEYFNNLYSGATITFGLQSLSFRFSNDKNLVFNTSFSIPRKQAIS